MTNGSEDRIDLRGDGRIILYKRAGSKDAVWQARIRVPNSTGYKRVTTKTSRQREAERFALDLYEDLYLHVKSGGSIQSRTFKQVFEEWKKTVTTMGHRGAIEDNDRLITFAVGLGLNQLTERCIEFVAVPVDVLDLSKPDRFIEFTFDCYLAVPHPARR